jgi:hypothetical protein
MCPNCRTIRDYWEENAHPLGLQYVSQQGIKQGSPEFFEHIRPWMNPYKFPWIMERIESESAKLKGKKLLEVGCGMGYDSLEFIKRGSAGHGRRPDAERGRILQAALRGGRRRGGRGQGRQCAGPAVCGRELRCGLVERRPARDGRHPESHRRGLAGAQAGRPGHHLAFLPQAVLDVDGAPPGRENIEYKDEDPPVNEFYTEAEVEAMFKGFEIEADLPRASPGAAGGAHGLKAALYKYVFMPLYNLLPESLARRYAYKYSVIAVKPASEPGG